METNERKSIKKGFHSLSLPGLYPAAEFQLVLYQCFLLRFFIVFKL